MAAYLSPAWFDDVNATARADATLPTATAGVHVVLQQVVSGGPAGDVRYWVRVDDGEVETGRGEAPHPDAVVTQSHDTAVAVSQGALTVEEALLTGRVRLSGDTSLLVRHQAALLRVAAALGPVRERTTYT